ncbi:hypothetical protein LEP1GSC007_1800 [Leptospira interrogans serovar Bulgarica str. Mallika]|nr:hypothetical protein LEP1GSC007_1800 [Leptospira interrogans serovar Bulgarica str. Mallika]
MRVFQAIHGEQKQIHRVSKKDAVDLRVGLKTGCTEKAQSYQCEMDKYYSEIPDAKIVPLIPKEKENLQEGRNRVPARIVMAGIIYRMKTGCQWRAIPNEFGSGQTCHRRFQEWERAGVFKKIYNSILKYYDVKNKIA